MNEWEKRKGERIENWREANLGGEHGGLERTD